jgi:serine/threonine protein kinase
MAATQETMYIHPPPAHWNVLAAVPEYYPVAVKPGAPDDPLERNYDDYEWQRPSDNSARYIFSDQIIDFGGMGRIILIWDTKMGMEKAAKWEFPEFYHNPYDFKKFREKFENEARVAGNTADPRIITIYDYLKHCGEAYIIMEYLDPREWSTVKQKMEQNTRGRPLPRSEVIQIARDVGDLLDDLAGRNILHNDITAGNIFLANGRTKVSDFGIARRLENGRFIIRPNDRIGDEDYMSYEAKHGDFLTPASDIYGLGVVLREAITGIPMPGQNRSLLGLLERNAVDPHTPFTSVPWLVQRFGQEACEHLYEYVFGPASDNDASLRPQSGREFAERLDQYLPNY